METSQPTSKQPISVLTVADLEAMIVKIVERRKINEDKGLERLVRTPQR